MMLCAKAGDDGAFQTLVRKHRGPIVRYLYGIVRDYAVSEELAQEVFLRVYRYREGYQVTAKFTTWLYRIAGHLALNWRRDHRRERLNETLETLPGHRCRHLADGAPRIDERLVTRHRALEVRQAVSELPERQRNAVILHKFREIPCDHIAAEWGCSHQAVRSTLFRAYAALRVRLSTEVAQGEAARC